MNELKYRFRMPIGDWSDDGHGLCNWVLVASNKTVEEVREIHYQSKDRTGIDIEEICAEYGEDVVSEDIKDKLAALGFAGGTADNKNLMMSPDDMAALWVFILEKTDATLKLQILLEDELPMLPFYGFDDQGRHIGGVGYGTFLD